VLGKSAPAHPDRNFREGKTMMDAKEIIKAISTNCT
jgi:hypothetical protein